MTDQPPSDDHGSWPPPNAGPAGGRPTWPGSADASEPTAEQLAGLPPPGAAADPGAAGADAAGSGATEFGSEQSPFTPGSGPDPGPSGGSPMGNNRGLIIAIAAAAVLVLLGGIIAALVVAFDAGSDDEPPVTATEREDATRPAGGERNDPSDVALEEMLTLIDESERTMLNFQEAVAFAVDVDQVETAAARAAENLGRIKGQLRAIEIVGSYDQALREVLDSYVAHLEAWETYAAATAETAEAYFDENGEFLQDINDTAMVFLNAMETELPDDIPQDLRDFAEQILDRGFRGADGPNGTLV